MRKFLLYWILGCIIMGVPFGRTISRCPRDTIEPQVMIAAIAAWPAMVIASFFVASGADRVCEK